MRRKERECSEPEFLKKILQQTDAISIAFYAEKYPYIIPVNYTLLNDALYFHCAKEGRKLECMKKNSNIGFSIYHIIDIDRDKATTHYISLYGEGQAVEVTDKQEKQCALASLAEKYKSNCKFPVNDNILMNTTIIKINIISMSGKKNIPD